MIELNDMERTHLKAGDALVLRPRRPVNMEQAARLVECAKHFSDETGIKMIVVDHDIDVLVAAEAEPA